ncbi:MAG TPA: hypothetical protein VFL17_11980 [Anaerolineae bacterium]|nr:hypothetical protein [Anaerolineae bacterium]
MRQKISVIHIALMLFGLLIVVLLLSGAVDAREPESRQISEVEAGEAPGGQGVPRRHVLGDGVPDTPLEVDMLHKQQDGLTE